MFALTADNLFTFSCQPWEYIKLIILHERRARQTDCRTRKKQSREFLTAVRGKLYTRFIYLRLKTTDFWATYASTWAYTYCSMSRTLHMWCRSSTICDSKVRLVKIKEHFLILGISVALGGKVDFEAFIF